MRSRGPARAAAASLVASLGLACAGTASAASFSLSPAAVSQPVASGFVGISTEYCSLAQYVTSPRDATGPIDQPALGVFSRLIENLSARPFVRIGGGSTEGITAVDRALTFQSFHDCPFNSGFPLSRGIVRAIDALRTRSDARLILGITLQGRQARRAIPVCEQLADDLPARERLAVAELRALRNARPYAFELGNEPLLCPDLFSDLRAWRGLVTRYGHGAGVAGPSLSETPFPWTRAQFRNFLSAAEPAAAGGHDLVTFHEYPLVGGIFDGHGGAGCLPSGPHGYLHDPPATRPTIAKLLSPSSVADVVGDVDRWVAPAHGRPVRVDEINSASHEGCGEIGSWLPRSNVSNTFAAALWALDSLFAFARHDVSGLNFHTIPGAPYELFSHIRCPYGEGNRACWLVHPEYYGLLAFATAAPAGSRLLRVGGSAPGLDVWSVRTPAARRRIVIVNESARPRVVRLSGLADGAAAVYRLLASSPAATAGITFGGSSFGPVARSTVDRRDVSGDLTTTGRLPALLPSSTLQVRGSSASVPVPADSAAIVTENGAALG